jgi:hypothetical protein
MSTQARKGEELPENNITMTIGGVMKVKKLSEKNSF